MSSYIKQLRAESDAANVRAEEQRVAAHVASTRAARERLMPLEDRLARVLKTIPREVQAEGLSLSAIQTSLRGRWRGHAHPGELGTALRKLGFRRRRRWDDNAGFRALWFPEKLEPDAIRSARLDVGEH
jgi:hypothetical protein